MIYLNNQLVQFDIFPNKEIRLDLDKSLLQKTNKVIWKFEDNSSIFELLALDRVMLQIEEIYNLFIPYMPYSRMDRINKENTAFTLAIMGNIFESLTNATNIYVLDPHSDKTIDVLEEENDVHITKYEYSLADEVLKNVDTSKVWIVFPDDGAAKRYNMTKYENVIVGHKIRDFQTGQIKSIDFKIAHQSLFLEEPAKLYIIDDLSSYGGTFVGILNCIKQSNLLISETNLIVTHAEEALTKGKVLDTFDNVYTTNSIATIEHQKVHQIDILNIYKG